MQSDFKHIDKQGIADPEAPNFTFEKSELPIWKYQSTSVQQQIRNAALFPFHFVKWGKEKLKSAYTTCQQTAFQTSWLDSSHSLFLGAVVQRPLAFKLSHSAPTNTRTDQTPPAVWVRPCLIDFNIFKRMAAYCKIRATFWLCSQQSTTAWAKKQERGV